jgi:beta-glucosidase
LSYSNFEYSNLNIPLKEFSKDDEVEVSFTVKNISTINGAEIAQLYIQDVKCSHSRPLKELKGFKKVSLKAGEEKEVKIVLDVKDFSYWNPDLKDWYAEPGQFNVLLGSSSDNILLKESVVLR